MAKANSNAAQAAAPAAQAAPVNSPVITLTAGAKVPAFRGARAAWWASVQAAAAQGLTVAQWQAAVLAAPPSTPTRGKLAGQCEPPSGWLRYFAGTKGGALITLV